MKSNIMKSLILAGSLVFPAAAFAGGGEKHAADWKQMDTDGDGKLSPTEHDAAAKKMFEAMDANKDSKVTAEEMTAAHAKVTGKKAKAGEMSAADKIKRVDQDGDGVLTAEEHAAAAKKMFTMIDADKDGFVSRGELEAGHARMMKDTSTPAKETK
jgi:Ca2+-binding EF-hand superfamily protein